MKKALGRLKEIAAAERPAYGKEVNRIKMALTATYEQALAKEKEKELARSLSQNALDVTLPGRPVPRGRLHVATQSHARIYAVFADLGFQVYRSREVEDDEHNFELLNMPPHHPARDMWDTFHTTTPGVILRTHTSPGQIHVMREQCPRPDPRDPARHVLPLRDRLPRAARSCSTRSRGWPLANTSTMADLNGTIIAFARRLFGEDRQVRIRSSYFPFTEPSIEVDMDCIVCAGSGCGLCKKTGWLEIMGAGMVHPVVLRHGGYDPERFSGFAFGMGPQRITMLKYAIDDIRQFWANDLRFLHQF